MKAITWLASVTVGVVGLSASALASAPEGWTDNLEEALKTAKKEKKSVLVEFTGSDWCPPCIMMKRNVFSKKEFLEGASKNFVLVHLDFPNGDKALAEKNEPIREKFSVEGFPTIVLLNADGKEFTRFIASEHPKVDAFLTHLDASLEKKDLD